MNWDIIKGNWKIFRGKAQEQWGKLTDDDLDVAEGNYDQFVGLTLVDAEKQVKDWQHRQQPL